MYASADHAFEVRDGRASLVDEARYLRDAAELLDYGLERGQKVQIVCHDFLLFDQPFCARGRLFSGLHGGSVADVCRLRGGLPLLFSEVFEEECDFVCERGFALDEIANFSIGVEHGGVVSVPEMLSDAGVGRSCESAAEIDCNVSRVGEAEIATMRAEFVDGDVVVGCASFLDIEDGGIEGV